jgi:hypothetical protein
MAAPGSSYSSHCFFCATCPGHMCCYSVSTGSGAEFAFRHRANSSVALDKDPWNDWLYVLNLHSLEAAARQLANRLGLMQARMPPDGFDVFVPPEAVSMMPARPRTTFGAAGDDRSCR